MFDKMKAFMDMQRKVQQIKQQLESSVFEVTSPDNLVKITMNGAQEVKEVNILSDISGLEKSNLEKAVKEAYNKAVKQAQKVATEKMKDITGLNLPG